MKRKHKKTYLLLTILFISIGFAFLTATLGIKGILSIKPKTLNVHYANLTVIDKNITGEDPYIDEDDDTSIEFDYAFQEPGEYIEFNFDVVNTGDFDAIITDFGVVVSVDGIEVEDPDFLELDIKYIDGEEIEEGHLLEKKTGTETVSVYAKFKEDSEVLPQGEKISIGIVMDYDKADKKAK